MSSEHKIILERDLEFYGIVDDDSPNPKDTSKYMAKYMSFENATEIFKKAFDKKLFKYKLGPFHFNESVINLVYAVTVNAPASSSPVYDRERTYSSDDVVKVSEVPDTHEFEWNNEAFQFFDMIYHVFTNEKGQEWFVRNEINIIIDNVPIEQCLLHAIKYHKDVPDLVLTKNDLAEFKSTDLSDPEIKIQLQDFDAFIHFNGYSKDKNTLFITWSINLTTDHPHIRTVQDLLKV